MHMRLLHKPNSAIWGAAISACRLCLNIVTALCILPTIPVHKAGSSQLSLNLRVM